MKGRLLILLFAFTSNASAGDKPTAQDWSKFWKRFQKAVAHQDWKTIESQSKFDSEVKSDWAKSQKEKKGFFFEASTRECFKKARPKFQALLPITVFCENTGYFFNWEDGRYRFTEVLEK